MPRRRDLAPGELGDGGRRQGREAGRVGETPGAATADGGRTDRQQRGLTAQRDSRGLPPPPPWQCQPRCSLPGGPHRRPSFTHAITTACNRLHPGAGRRGHFLAAVTMATSLPSSPAHGTRVRAAGELAAGCSSSSRIIRSLAAARRSRNAGADVCELELMDMDRMFRLHIFTDVCSPGTGG